MGKIIGTFFVWLWAVITWWYELHVSFFNAIGFTNSWLEILFIIIIPILMFVEIIFAVYFIRFLVPEIAEQRKPKHCMICNTLLKEKDNYCSANCEEKAIEEDRLQDIQWREVEIRKAETFEQMGRYEEAALIYEELELFDKAGEARKLGKTEYVKTTKLDINQLISQLKEIVNYKCPSCGAGIDIHSKTSVDGLKFCSHCGLALNSSGITKFLLKVL